MIDFQVSQHPEQWTRQSITEHLLSAKIVSVQPMREFLERSGKTSEFNGEVFLVTLENDVCGVFKALSDDDYLDAIAEVGAYKVSLKLGFPCIPPTVLRSVNGKQGSLQLFINNKIDLLQENNYLNILSSAGMEDLINLKIFYFVFGQWDSGPHNLLAYQDDLKTYLIAIDNSGIRNHQHVKYGNLPFVRVVYSDELDTNDWNTPFPFEKAEVIHPSRDVLRSKFTDKLPESFYENFVSYDTPLSFIIYNNALWRQYHAFDETFVKSYSQEISKKTLEALHKIDLSLLENIFGEHIAEFDCTGIIERRDQVLNHCKIVDTFD